MSEKPDRIAVACEGCKREASLAAIHRAQGACPNCGHAAWHVQAAFLARSDNSDATSLTLNALGLSLLTNSGIHFASPVPGEKRPVNGIDIHDVPADEMLRIASPEVDPQIKLLAFVQFKRNQQFSRHRQAMQLHGNHCDQCGVLFVVNDQKPWTVIGCCSKVCCAAKLGAVDYALIEDQVLEQAQQHLPQLKQLHRQSQVIQVICPSCNHNFELPRIYVGLQRKCPVCAHKVRVPDG
ncbi:MAG: hypothetical protein KF752_15035 [Pirellulaceae bacterium]|nr:hypothetical protein [Pirellulaceae bacterium]